MTTTKAPGFRKFIAAISIMLACNTHAGAQTGIDTSLSNLLQRSIDSMLTQYNVKGISAAAYIPGAGMWTGTAGESYAGVPIDTSMLFSIGSITKTFIAAEIFKLIDAGQLALTDTIGGILPPMTNVNGAITVKQLLGHTSAMGDYLSSSWGSAMLSNPTVVWYFPSAFAAFSTPATGAPGSSWHYCNANYALLGMIIEAKTGDSVHHVLRNDLLQPYGLHNTHMEIFEPYANAIPHNWTTPTLNPALATDASATPHEALWSSTEPAGGLFSDAANIAWWGYNLYSGKVLSPSSLSQMVTFIAAPGGYFNGYGLGSMRFPANLRNYWGHGGNYYGYAASMLYYPKDSICVSVLINQDCIATYEARQLINVLIGNLATAVRKAPSGDNITLAPNPANNEITVNTPGNTTNMQIELNDVTGKNIYKTICSTGSITINTRDFTTGEYFVKITGNGRTITKQIIVGH